MEGSKWPEVAGLAFVCAFGAVLARGWPAADGDLWDAAAAIGTLLAVVVALGVALREGAARRMEEAKRRDFAFAAVAVRLGSLAGAVGISVFAVRQIVEYGVHAVAVNALEEGLDMAGQGVANNANLPLRDLPHALAQDLLSAFVSIGEAQSTFALSKKHFVEERNKLPGDYRAKVIASNLTHAQNLLREVATACATNLSHPISVPPDMKDLVREGKRSMRGPIQQSQSADGN